MKIYNEIYKKYIIKIYNKKYIINRYNIERYKNII